MNNDAYDLKSALPNKVLDENGNITDLFGNSVEPSSQAYMNKPSLPNKWLNADGTYSTLVELISQAIDTDIFVIVTELPTVGEENKIYLVPKENHQGFVEWIYADGQWDTLGELEIDLSDYPTIEDMQQYVGNNTLTKTNTTAFTPTADYHPATKKYVDENTSEPRVFSWDGSYGTKTQKPELIKMFQDIYELSKTTPVIIIRNSEQQYDDGENGHKGIFFLDKTSVKTNNKMRLVPLITNAYCTHETSVTRIPDTFYHTVVLNFTAGTDNIISITQEGMSGGAGGSIGFVRVLDTVKNYSTPYIPQYPGSPATKKYVDDAIANNVTTMLNGNY